MIESVTVTNYLGESREMVLADPEPSGFIVKSIDGLGPSTANINFSELVTIDGAIENSTKLNTREIKIDLIFLDNPTIEDTRHLTYKYFPVKRPVTLTVKTKTFNNERILHCYGTVEKNDPKIFSQQEGCSITIKCGDPYWHTETFTKKMFYGTEPLFEFPFSNESNEEERVFGYSDVWLSREYIVEGQYRVDSVRSYSAPIIHLRAGKIREKVDGKYEYLFDMMISRLPNSPYYVPINAPEGALPIKRIFNDQLNFVIDLDYTGNTINITSGTYGDENVGKYFTDTTELATVGSNGTALVGDDIEFGNINFLTEGTVNYAGDSETGLILTIHAYGAASNIEFYDIESGDKIAISDEVLAEKTGSGIVQGDEIVISMVRGKKSATLIRNGAKYDILNALISPIKWFKLNKGSNEFGYKADLPGLENLVFTVAYDELYEGI